MRAMPRDAQPAPQLSLFAAPDPMREVYAQAAAIAERIPGSVHLGTSSWNYPGWRGAVYAEARSEAALARDGLREYARHPLLRTVGIDRTFYAPVPGEDFERYATQLPSGFRCCIKAPASVTSAVMLGSDRAGAPRINPDFLSYERYMRDLGGRLLEHFAEHTGPVMFEVPRVSRELTARSEDFARGLDALLAAAPPSIAHAVELREGSLFTPRYVKALRARGASHVYNWWTAMPTLSAQARAVPPEEMPHMIVRVVIPPGSRYDDRKRAFAPFDRVQEPSQEMRAEVVDLVRRAARAGIPSWVLVNNKAEGSSPGTVLALARMLADAFG